MRPSNKLTLPRTIDSPRKKLDPVQLITWAACRVSSESSNPWRHHGETVLAHAILHLKGVDINHFTSSSLVLIEAMEAFQK